jgi:hypothetical protein
MMPVSSQFTKIPETRHAKGDVNLILRASDSLEEKTREPIGKNPIEGSLLFYAELSQEAVLNPKTKLELYVQDIFETKSVAIQTMGDWLRSRSAMILLRDAAREFYGEMRGTDIGGQMDWKSDATKDERLDWAATPFFEGAAIEVKVPPSQKWESLPESKKAELLICDGANGLKGFDDDHATYTEPRLKRSDAGRIIAEQKQKAKRL